jgi:signal recognition particle subunit SRP54
MFEAISESLTRALDRIRGRRRLTEKNIQEGMREVRRALLEADVHYKVVKHFIDRVTERAIGQDLIRNITAGQQIVKIVQDELEALMGPVDTRIEINQKGPTTIMMVGLHGCGKTTTCAKLARFLQKKGHRPLLVAADVQRPAAIEQLKVLGTQLNIPVYFEEPGWLRGKAPSICSRSLKHAEKNGLDVVILDTAGRLHIDEELMKELRDIKRKTNPQNIFLVCDAMTGQDAVNSAKEFNERLAIDGVVLTKLDGDARGGAALSVRTVTGRPIKFVGVGEKLDKIEEFYPDRMASRILGMGDVVTLVEKAQEAMDREETERLGRKLLEDRFTLEDFLQQLQQIKKMGPIKDLLGMIPGLGSQLKGIEIEGNELVRIEAIIQSMTAGERENPDILNASRRKRIAKGCGCTPAEVGQLIKQFRQMKKMVKSMTRFGGVFPGMPAKKGKAGKMKRRLRPRRR